MCIPCIVKADPSFQQVLSKNCLLFMADDECTRHIEYAGISQTVATDFTWFVFLKVVRSVCTEMTGIHIPEISQIVDSTSDCIILIGNDVTRLRIRLSCHGHGREQQPKTSGKPFLHMQYNYK